MSILLISKKAGVKRIQLTYSSLPANLPHQFIAPRKLAWQFTPRTVRAVVIVEVARVRMTSACTLNAAWRRRCSDHNVLWLVHGKQCTDISGRHMNYVNLDPVPPVEAQ